MIRKDVFKKYGMKITALCMIGIMAGSMAVPASAAAEKNTVEKKTEKTETVYVNADAEGNVTQTIVSDYLKNRGKKQTIEDKTMLKKIENVKGDETFSKNADGSITWNADGNDIFYQGKTTEKLPVSVKVTYYLDGREVSPDEIAGKSGDIKIRFDYYNHSDEAVKVGAKEYHVQIPFTMVTAMILPDDIFSDVEVTNGKCISDGEKNVVAGIAFPGLKDSLTLENTDFDEIGIPDYVEVSAKAEKFKLDLTATIAMTGNAEDLDIGKIDDVTDLTDKMDELTDASKQLVEGSDALREGLDTFDKAFKTYRKGVGTADKGAKKLNEGLKLLDSRKDALKDGADALSNGLADLKKGMKTLNGGIGQYTQGVTTLSDGIKTAKKGAEDLRTGADALKKGITDYTNGVKQLDAGTGALAEAVSGLKLPDEETLKQIGAASAGLAANAQKLQKYLESMEGVLKQLDGLKENLTLYQSGLKQQIGAVKTELGQVDGKATEQARKQAEAVLEIPGLTKEQKDAIRDTISGITISGVTDSTEKALDHIPALTVPDIKIETGEITKILMEMSGQAGILKEFGKQVSGMTGSLPVLKEAVKQLKGGSSALVSKNAMLIGGMEQLTGGLDTLSDGLGKLTRGAGQLTDQNKTLTGGADQAEKGSAKLADGSRTLVQGVTELNQGIGQLSDGSSVLAAGTGKLNESGDIVQKGILSLKDGSTKLADGMKKLDEEGISRLADLAGDDLQGIVDHLKAVKEADGRYHSFAGMNPDMKGSVKIMIETAPVKAE